MNSQGVNYGYGNSTTAASSRASHGGTVQVMTTSTVGGQNVRKVSEVMISEKFVMPSKAYEQSSRKVSSVVVFEEPEVVPEKNVRYVAVPQYEEIIKHVPRKEIREVEKIVPKVVEEWVERIVEVPQLEEVVRHVEVPQVQEVVKHVPKIEVVDRPYEVIKEVPRVQINKVEKVVEMAADIVEVPKAQIIEERIAISNYDDKDAMLIVSQAVKPVIIDHHHAMGAGQKEVVVDVIEYEPEVMPVDIHVAKFIDQELVMLGTKEIVHKAVTVGAAQYNSMLRYLNVHLPADEVAALPYLSDSYGQVSFLPQEFSWFPPQEGYKVIGYRAGQLWGEGQVVAQTQNGMTENEIRMKQGELDRQFQQIIQQFENEKIRRINIIEEFNRKGVETVRLEIQNNNQSQSQSHSLYAPWKLSI